MTRKSRREIKREIDDLDADREFTLQDYLWADLKNAYDGRLSRGERRLLDDPRATLSPVAARKLDGVGGSQ